MGLFDRLFPTHRVSRELDRDPLVPPTPMVPESGVAVHQVEKVGGLQWQMRQLREAEERLDAKAARAGARARLRASREMARGSPAFGSTATSHQDANGNQFTANLVHDYRNAEQDERLLDLPGGLAPEMARYRKRDAGRAAAPETIPEAERVERVRQMRLSRPVTVKIPGFVLHMAIDPDRFIAEKLATSGADISHGRIETVYKDPGSWDITAVWYPGEGHGTQADEHQGQEGPDAQGPGQGSGGEDHRG